MLQNSFSKQLGSMKMLKKLSKTRNLDFISECALMREFGDYLLITKKRGKTFLA